jgi:hypothetical protein
MRQSAMLGDMTELLTSGSGRLDLVCGRETRREWLDDYMQTRTAVEMIRRASIDYRATL